MGGQWGVEAAISEPFNDCEDTLVRRISWSPDGQFLVATNSKDGVSPDTMPFWTLRMMEITTIYSVSRVSFCVENP